MSTSLLVLVSPLHCHRLIYSYTSPAIPWWCKAVALLSGGMPHPESPALPVLQTLMNAPSRTSVSLGPARTCLGCSAVPVMKAMNWTGVEATAQV